MNLFRMDTFIDFVKHCSYIPEQEIQFIIMFMRKVAF